MKPAKNLRSLPQDALYDEISSPVGQLIIIASSKGLHAILWNQDRKNFAVETIIQTLKRSKHDGIILATKNQLAEYFLGKRKIFDVPLVLNGTNFQIQAWQQLLKIPYAATISYAQQAEKIGDKNKARAVGMANGQNPLSIIIPCHRVIGANGHLVGFGGGIEKKSYLLQLEQKWKHK